MLNIGSLVSKYDDQGMSTDLWAPALSQLCPISKRKGHQHDQKQDMKLRFPRAEDEESLLEV
jgi:hypothetical protein